MAQPVRLGIVFPRSGQTRFVTVPVKASVNRNQTPIVALDRTCRAKAAEVSTARPTA